MPTKYIDHGAYGSAVFTASIATNTMTVTAVTSGIICVGAIVESANITNKACYISAFVSGTNGGVGVYTLTQGNTIASAACTSTAGTPPAVPLTWGLPQEGDGTGSAPATNSAVASITFSAIPTSGVISVMGASVSTTGVLAAASADAAANALATNINATVNVVTVLSTGWFANKLQDAVYARGPALGAPAGTCQIMTRAGSAVYNSLSIAGIAYTLNNVSSGASPLLFTGGTGGCWGLLGNTAAASFPSLITIGTYGCVNGSGSPRYLAGVILAGDVINIRPRTIISPATSDVSYYFLASGASGNSITYVIDDGSVWGGSDNKQLIFAFNSAVAGTITGPLNANIYAAKNSDGTLKLRFLGLNSSVGSLVVFQVGASFYADALYMGSYPDGINRDYRLAFNTFQTVGFVTITEVQISKPVNTAYLHYANSSQSIIKANIKKLILDATGSSSINPGVIKCAGSTTTSPIVLNIDSLDCSNFVIGSILHASFVAAVTLPAITIKNADIPNITFNSPVISSQTTLNIITPNKYLSLTTASSSRDMILDTVQGYCDWLSQRLFPKLSATLPNGASLWSLRFIPTTVSVNIGINAPYSLPEINQYNTLTDGARTFTLEYCLEATLFAMGSPPDTSNMWVEISYINTLGDTVLLSSKDVIGSALTVSGTTWNQELSGQVTFDNAGTIYLDKKKFVLTTLVGNNLKADTLVVASIKAAYVPSSNAQFGFINPELGIV